MEIKLWSRQQGLVRPPETLLYAERDRHDFSESFRKRICMWADTSFQRLEHGTPMGEVVNDHNYSWARLYQGLSAAYGRSPLVPLREIPGRVHSQADLGPIKQLGLHVLTCPDNEVMDFIAAVFQVSATVADDDGGEAAEIGGLVNTIFEEEGVGYRWVSDQLVRYEPVTHELAIEPAVELLDGGTFGEANSEFAAALDAYRDGRWRDAITNANAAFESVLKVQTGESKLVAGKLIRAAREQGVIPGYMEVPAEHFDRLMQVVPAARGNDAAHGLGDRLPTADQHLAQFVVSVTAAFILFVGRPTS